MDQSAPFLRVTLTARTFTTPDEREGWAALFRVFAARARAAAAKGSSVEAGPVSDEIGDDN